METALPCCSPSSRRDAGREGQRASRAKLPARVQAFRRCQAGLLPSHGQRDVWPGSARVSHAVPAYSLHGFLLPGQGVSHRHVSDHLSELVETILADLEQVGPACLPACCRRWCQVGYEAMLVNVLSNLDLVGPACLLVLVVCLTAAHLQQLGQLMDRPRSAPPLLPPSPCLLCLTAPLPNPHAPAVQADCHRGRHGPRAAQPGHDCGWAGMGRVDGDTGGA